MASARTARRKAARLKRRAAVAAGLEAERAALNFALAAYEAVFPRRPGESVLDVVARWHSHEFRRTMAGQNAVLSKPLRDVGR